MTCVCEIHYNFGIWFASKVILFPSCALFCIGKRLLVEIQALQVIVIRQKLFHLMLTLLLLWLILFSQNTVCLKHWLYNHWPFHLFNWQEADLVLGGDDGKECTYNKGYMKRQAIFSCLTCTPDGNAGVCTACSLSCHDGHQVVVFLWI